MARKVILKAGVEGIVLPNGDSYDADDGIAIATSTNATPPQVNTAAVHGLTTGDYVYIAGHLVNTNCNGYHRVTVVDTDSFTLDDVAGNGVGGATGTVREDFIEITEADWAALAATVAGDEVISVAVTEAGDEVILQGDAVAAPDALTSAAPAAVTSSVPDAITSTAPDAITGANAVGAAPDAAEHNALVVDVTNLQADLTAVRVDVVAIQADLTTTQADVVAVHGSVTDVQADVDAIHAKLDALITALTGPNKPLAE